MNSWSAVSGILTQRSSVAYLLGQFTDDVTTLLIDYHLSQRKIQPHNIIQSTFLYWPPGVCEYYKEAIHNYTYYCFSFHKICYGRYRMV